MSRIPLKTGQVIEFTSTSTCKIINRYDDTWPKSVRVQMGQDGIIDMSYTVLPGEIPVELHDVILSDISSSCDPDMDYMSIVVSVREGAIGAYQFEYDQNGHVVKKVFRNDEELIIDD